MWQKIVVWINDIRNLERIKKQNRDLRKATSTLANIVIDQQKELKDIKKFIIGFENKLACRYSPIRIDKDGTLWA